MPQKRQCGSVFRQRTISFSSHRIFSHTGKVFLVCVRLCYLTLLTVYVLYTYNFMVCRVFVGLCRLGWWCGSGSSHPHPKMPILCVNFMFFHFFRISCLVQHGCTGILVLCFFPSAVMPTVFIDIFVYYFSFAFYGDEEHKYANNYFTCRIFFGLIARTNCENKSKKSERVKERKKITHQNRQKRKTASILLECVNTIWR